MAPPRALLRLGAAVALLSPAAAVNSCSANSVPYCWQGIMANYNYSSLAPYGTSASSDPSFYFKPQVDGAFCNCVSFVSGGSTYYTAVDSSRLASYQTNPSYAAVTACNTTLCNCASPGCPASPFGAGMCPLAGSTGPLACRVGYVGSLPSDNGPPRPVRASTPGNLQSQTFPAGSVCLSAPSADGTLTTYINGSAAQCAYLRTRFGRATTTGCVTDNCGAPEPTGAACPTATSATQCFVGMTGTSGAAAAVAAVLSAGSNAAMTWSTAAPSSVAVPTGSACTATTETCDSLVASSAGMFNTSNCPVGSTFFIYTAVPLVPSAAGASCNSWLISASSVGFTGFVTCGTSNCNAPSAPVYLAASATLGGYTAATFGAKEVGQFQSAMATALSVASTAVTVTSVANAASRRHLLAGSVAVGFSVLTTVSNSRTMSAALATPPSAAALQSAGLAAVTSASVVLVPAANGAAAPVAVSAASLNSTGTAKSAAVKTAGVVATAAAALLTSALLA